MPALMGGAREILSAGETLVTSDHVLLETWTLLRARIDHASRLLRQRLRCLPFRAPAPTDLPGDPL